jgi:hypothetical protein
MRPVFGEYYKTIQEKFWDMTQQCLVAVKIKNRQEIDLNFRRFFICHSQILTLQNRNLPPHYQDSAVSCCNRRSVFGR